jgi:hypothetical protein
MHPAFPVAAQDRPRPDIRVLALTDDGSLPCDVGRGRAVEHVNGATTKVAELVGLQSVGKGPE